MCLILLAWNCVPGAPLIVAANRDERYARAAAPAAFWPDAAQILAGRDLEAGGTWLGVTRSGRFAAVTNYHAPHTDRGARSRGELPVAFLAGSASAREFLDQLSKRAGDYGPYTLLVSDGATLWWHSNRARAPEEVGSGVLALGNALPGDDHPRVRHGRARFGALLGGGAPDPQVVLELLCDPAPPPGADSPWCSLLLRGEEYGTRCSTVLIRTEDGWQVFVERRHAPPPGGETRHVLDPVEARPA